MLKEQTISEFRQILNEDYGENINTKEATEMAENFVNYFTLLLKMNNKKDQEYDYSRISTKE